MPEAIHFTCSGCGKHHLWTPGLAGKRAKCKCGVVMTVPTEAPSTGEPEDLYDLAPGDNSVAPAPPSKTVPLRPANKTTPAAHIPGAKVALSGPPALAYAGSVPKQLDHFSHENLIDPTRDIHAPVALLIAGLLLYVFYYATRYHLTGVGIVYAATGLSLLTAGKAALLVGFALMTAGPLGVSYGGVWTAVLKLAAIAVFSEGITTWIDSGVRAMTGGAGGMEALISFPISLGVYWLLLIYLFSMDPADSWTVVILLALFDFLVRWALVFFLLSGVLQFGGAKLPATGNAKTSRASTLTLAIEQARNADLIKEARQWSADGHGSILQNQIEAWYAAGAKNVLFEIGYDVTHKPEIKAMYLELPDDKDQRAVCYQILGDYYKNRFGSVRPSELVDTGEPYISVRISLGGKL